MKIQLSALYLALLACGNAHADEAAQTRAHYSAVNRAIPKATVVKRDLQGYSAEGGELTAYFGRGAPLKFVAKYYGESGRATEEYYFWQGRLFFILRTSEKYDVPIGASPTPGKVNSRMQERWYFKNGKLWRWIKSDGKTVESGAEFRNQNDNYLSLAREFLAGARATNPIIEAR